MEAPLWLSARTLRPRSLSILIRLAAEMMNALRAGFFGGVLFRRFLPAFALALRFLCATFLAGPYFLAAIARRVRASFYDNG